MGCQSSTVIHSSNQSPMEWINFRRKFLHMINSLNFDLAMVESLHALVKKTSKNQGTHFIYWKALICTFWKVLSKAQIRFLTDLQEKNGFCGRKGTWGRCQLVGTFPVLKMGRNYCCQDWNEFEISHAGEFFRGSECFRSRQLRIRYPLSTMCVCLGVCWCLFFSL